MRIEFPNSAREDFRWTQARLRVGSAPDNDLVVASSQAAGHHLRIEQDRRGWVLQVMPSCGRVYVNARPVRERALLRPGDILSIGDCRMLLCADEDPVQRARLTLADKGCSTVALRAVAGPWSGRVLPVRDRLELGSQGGIPLELPQGERASFALAWRDGQLWLDAGSLSSRYPLRVNGVAVKKVALQPGDQIDIAMHRFVLEAPGMVATPKIAVAETPSMHLPEEAAGPRGEVWWLIATAAVLALGIALMLLIRF
jgi:pSer/pThr/pTyr-binding forkhead associated (FHA) protein